MGGDGGEGAEVHQQLRVPGHDQHLPLGAGECEPEPRHARRPHRARHREEVAGVAGHRSHVPGRAGKPGNDEEVLMRADEHRDAFLLGGQRHRVHFRVRERAVDEHRVTGTGAVSSRILI